MRLTQTLNAAAQSRRNHVGTIHGDRKRTWGEIATRVSRVAAGLAGLGVAAGDRIAMLALNSDRYVESFFAIAPTVLLSLHSEAPLNNYVPLLTSQWQ